MKQVKVILEYDNETLGENWLNMDNLKLLLYDNIYTNSILLRILSYEELENEEVENSLDSK